ncbi:hypothetical protein [Planococcus sp. YIM B11945]|uniref:hypothetical protein n=1 Tax=Planococcus sp. YIM B11945 TaxID=3435410 RepID=UPI003D7DD465
MRKDEFISWLKVNTPVSSSTAQKYSGAINTISKGLNKYGLLDGNLYNIQDSAVIESLSTKYFSIGEFNEKDIRGNRMYSNAAKYFKKFVKET